MSLKQTTGSRAQVMHGTAKKTSGGLTKSQLKYNKQGKIVSKKASALAKKNNRLVKAGYVTTKGVFGSGGGKMRGGMLYPNPEAVKLELCSEDKCGTKPTRGIFSRPCMVKDEYKDKYNVSSCYKWRVDEKKKTEVPKNEGNIVVPNNASNGSNGSNITKLGTTEHHNPSKYDTTISLEENIRGLPSINEIKWDTLYSTLKLPLKNILAEFNSSTKTLQDAVAGSIILGYGTFGIVFKKDITIGNIPRNCAIKMYKQNKIPNEIDIFLEIRDQLYLQSSDYVPTIYGYCISGNYISIIMELCEGPDLYDYLDHKFFNAILPTSINANMINTIRELDIVNQVAYGLKDIHAKNYAWRDLKPENIILSSKDGTLAVKLIDFGLGEHMNNAVERKRFQRRKGTPTYFAPEQHLKPNKRGGITPPFNIKESQKTDIYSFGVLIAEIFKFSDIGNLNYYIIDRKSYPRQFEQYKRRVKPLFKKPVWNMIDQCTQKEPDDRPTIDEFISEYSEYLKKHIPE